MVENWEKTAFSVRKSINFFLKLWPFLSSGSIVHNLFSAQALIEMGESLKQMADNKYSLDDNVKQNFLEPLHHLQTKDLKEVMVREKINTLVSHVKVMLHF